MLINYTPTSGARKGAKIGAGSMLLGGAGSFGLGMLMAWKGAKTDAERDKFPQFWKDWFKKDESKAKIDAPQAVESVAPVDAEQVAEAATQKTPEEAAGINPNQDTIDHYGKLSTEVTATDDGSLPQSDVRGFQPSEDLYQPEQPAPIDLTSVQAEPQFNEFAGMQ